MRFRLLVLAICALMLASCAPSDSPSSDASAPSDEARATSPTPEGIAFLDRGAGDTTVVLVHGWSCEKSHWSAQIDALEESYRVVAIDLGGHGESEGIERESWTLDSLAADVVSVADHLGLERTILVGHSMGGPVSLLAAAKMPGRVLGMIGVDTIQDADFEWSEERFAAAIEAMEADFAGTCGQMVRGMYGESSDTELVESTVSMMCDAPPEIALALFRDFPKVSVGEAMSGAGVPVRAINAPTFPTNFDANRKYAPDFDAVTMEGVGHFLFLEEPEAFNEHLLAFVRELEQGG